MDKTYLITLTNEDLERLITKCINKSLRLYVVNDATPPGDRSKKKANTPQIMEVANG